MRVILVAGLIGLSAAAAVAAGARPAALWETYQQLYPSDPAQRQALDRCFLEDRRFDRFDPAARAQCYNGASLRGAAAVASNQASSLAMPPNFVDLWRAASQGRMPQNDVRTTEQNRRYHDQLASGQRAAR